MKFGLQLPTFGDTASPDLVLRSARLAEELGFDSVWANDHILVPPALAVPYASSLECVVTLATVAPITERVSLGTSVIVLPQRNPILLAKQIATLDVASGGRVICGVAPGYVEEEMRFLGADYEHRGRITDEYLGIMRHLWTYGGGTLETPSLRFRDALFSPRPLQGGRLPIWIAGNGTRAIRRAATSGDYWHPGALTVEEVARGAVLLHELAETRKVSISVKLRVLMPGVADGTSQRSPDMYSHSHDLVGPIERMTAELAQYADAGVDHVVVFFYHESTQQLERSISAFAQEVMPQLRS